MSVVVRHLGRPHAVFGAFLAVSVAAAAHARPEYPDYIPSAPVDGRCGTCHEDRMGGGARNAFGADVEATIDTDGPNWSLLYCVDSDGDGLTNGQELGDPCGTWAPGEAPKRSEPLSAPGDSGDAIEIDDSDACDGSPPPDCASPQAASVGCRAQAPAAESTVLLVALLVLSRARRRLNRRA